MEKRRIADHHAAKQRGRNAAKQRAARTRRLPRADVLRDERAHRLHIGGRDEHDKPAQLFRHAHACRLNQAEPVDNRQNHQKGDAHQQILQRHRRADAKNMADHRAVTPDIAAGEFKRQLPAGDDAQRQKHADRLRENRRQRRAGRAHMEQRNQQQIAEDIRRAGNRHGDQRHLRIADAAEDAAQHVEGDDEHRARRADAHIGNRRRKGVLGRMQKRAKRRRQHDEHRRHRKREYRKQPDAAADHSAGLLPAALADLLPQQHRHAHRKADDHRRHRMHELTAGRHRGYVRRLGVLPHDQQIDRAVHRLQEQRRQHRQRKADQRPENRAFRKIPGSFHHVRLHSKTGRIKRGACAPASYPA